MSESMNEEMTLEEAINHFLELTKRDDDESKNWQYGADHIDDANRRKQYQKNADYWKRSAAKCRQIAAWLEELRDRRRMEEI